MRQLPDWVPLPEYQMGISKGRTRNCIPACLKGLQEETGEQIVRQSFSCFHKHRNERKS